MDDAFYMGRHTGILHLDFCNDIYNFMVAKDTGR